MRAGPVEIEQQQIGGRALGQAALGQAEEIGRRRGDPAQQIDQPPLALVIELQGQGQQGLQPDDPRGRLGEGHALGFLVMGRMVAGDAIDRAVGHCRGDGLAVGLAAQRRGELGEGAVVADRRTR